MSINDLIKTFYNPNPPETPCDTPPRDATWMVDSNKIYHIYREGQGYCSTANKNNAEHLLKLLKEHDTVGRTMTPAELAAEKRMAAIRDLDFQLDTVKTLIICLVGITVGKLL